MGPFETWQAAGWAQVAKWIAEDIAAGKTMSSAPLPAWVTDGRSGVHAPEGSYLRRRPDKMVGRSALPVYKRQLFPELVLGEKPADGHYRLRDDGVRMWHHAGERTSPSSRSRARCTRSAPTCSKA